MSILDHLDTEILRAKCSAMNVDISLAITTPEANTNSNDATPKVAILVLKLLLKIFLMGYCKLTIHLRQLF